MRSVLRLSLFGLLFAGLFSIANGVSVNDAMAGKARYFTGDIRGTAAGGYDPVAYFTQSKPVRGKKEISAEWDGVTWRFSSEENKLAFLADPKKFAPQFGGYCAYAVAIGRTARGNPKNWKIVNGKLYLNYNSSIQRTWEKKQSSYITKANKNWPRVIK